MRAGFSDGLSSDATASAAALQLTVELGDRVGRGGCLQPECVRRGFIGWVGVRERWQDCEVGLGLGDCPRERQRDLDGDEPVGEWLGYG